MPLWLLLLIGMALVALIWGTLIERHWYAVREESLSVLPNGSKPIRVLHIGDLHLARWQRRKVRFLKRLPELRPDLVVNTGDNLGALDSESMLLSALQPLASKPGVFVNGSNDYHAPRPRNPFSYLKNPSRVQGEKPLNTQLLLDGFTGFGWLNLNNAGGTLTINGTLLQFAGVDDAHDNLDDLSVATKTLKVDVGFKLGVSHAPYLRVIDAFEKAGCRVMFAGHTHGGQVCLPWFGAIITNCDLPRQFAKGVSYWGPKKMMLNVVAGLGHSIFAPVRFFCRPEVRVITLVAA